MKKEICKNTKIKNILIMVSVCLITFSTERSF